MKRCLTGFALLLVACTVHAQKIDDPKPLPDFSNDPCGSPYVESQLWIGREGKVLKVVDGRTIQVALNEGEAPGILKVRLAGVALDPRSFLSKKAAEHLAQVSLGKPVSVLVNPEDRQHKRVTGTVVFNEGGEGDIGLALLAGGWVRYQDPPPYKMSGHTACHYRAAEAEARSKKLGVWE